MAKRVWTAERRKAIFELLLEGLTSGEVAKRWNGKQANLRITPRQVRNILDQPFGVDAATFDRARQMRKMVHGGPRSHMRGGNISSAYFNPFSGRIKCSCSLIFCSEAPDWLPNSYDGDTHLEVLRGARSMTTKRGHLVCKGCGFKVNVRHVVETIAQAFQQMKPDELKAVLARNDWGYFTIRRPEDKNLPALGDFAPHSSSPSPCMAHLVFNDYHDRLWFSIPILPT